MDIQWNTGAHYTKEGQIIRAVAGTKAVAFTDFSRGITGVMNLPKIEGMRTYILESEEAFKRWVHDKYLHNDYQPGYQFLARKV